VTRPSSTLPKDLPRTLALFVALPFAAFEASAMLAELVFGRPKSTAGVGYMLLPFVAAAFGLVAFGIGLLLRGLWRRSGWRTCEGPTVERKLLAALALVTGGACVTGAVGSLMRAASAATGG